MKASEELGKLEPKLMPDVVLTSHSGGTPVFIAPGQDELRTDLELASHWVRSNQAALDETLLAAGAYVLRGFPVHSTTDFDTILAGYPAADIDYSGGAAPRSTILGRVYEASRFPSDLSVTLHQEMAYLPKFPARLSFYCHVPSATGGETILGNMRRYEAGLPTGIKDKVRKLGLIYRRNYRPQEGEIHPLLAAIHRPWSDVFGTLDPKEVERACEGMQLKYEWLPDGSLTTDYHAPGFRPHPRTAQPVWFNQIAAFTLHPSSIGIAAWNLLEEHYPPGKPRGYDVLYGDGSTFSADEVDVIYRLLDEVTIAFPWQAGDVMVVDNFLVAHGRSQFTGDRNVQVMLLQ